MIDLILRDAEMYPRLFWWTTPLSISAIEDWEREHSLRVPRDLKDLWSLKGGADLFDAETILQPFGAKEDYDLIEPVSQVFWSRGLDTSFCVFHTGVWDSVFRKSDGALFSLNSSEPSQMSSFQDFNEWYQALRAEYAERYALRV
jgi:hypothetical protein